MHAYRWRDESYGDYFISPETTGFPIKHQIVFSLSCFIWTSNQIYLWTLQYDIFWCFREKKQGSAAICRWSGAHLAPNGVPFGVKFNRKSVITIQISFSLTRIIDILLCACMYLDTSILNTLECSSTRFYYRE